MKYESWEVGMYLNILLLSHNSLFLIHASYFMQSGYSLIELLIVMAILAILAAIGLTNYRSASLKARDTRRIADLEQIRGALELYRSDQGSYPTTNQFPACNAALQNTTGTNIYMRSMPCDPTVQAPNNRYGYSRISAYQYYLGAMLELPSAQTSPISCASVSMGAYNYCIANP